MEPTLALVIGVYLVLQLAALKWMAASWRQYGKAPAFALLAGAGVAALGATQGIPLLPYLLGLGLPALTLYLLILWPAYLVGQRAQG